MPGLTNARTVVRVCLWGAYAKGAWSARTTAGSLRVRGAAFAFLRCQDLRLQRGTVRRSLKSKSVTVWFGCV
jgi:hypothetical protein